MEIFSFKSIPNTFKMPYFQTLIFHITLMNIDEFIKLIEPEFDEVAAGTIKPESEFRTLEGWSSMMALIVISRINKNCKVAVSAQELALAKTIADLYNITSSKLQTAN